MTNGMNQRPAQSQISEALAVALANEHRRRCVRIKTTFSRCKAFVSYPELNQLKFPVHTLGEFGAKFDSSGSKLSNLKGYEATACLHLGPFKVDLKSRMIYNDPRSTA